MCELEGRHVDTIYNIEFGYEKYPGVDLPGPGKLMNFEFKMAGRKWLYLDSYGDEVMPPEIHERFFGAGPRESIAVCLETGDLALARLQEGDEGKIELFVRSVRSWAHMYLGKAKCAEAYKVPKEYLGLLDGLRYQKRPFHMSVLDRALFNFIDRELGYQQLVEYLIISLDLRPKGILEILGDSYRWVSVWE